MMIKFIIMGIIGIVLLSVGFLIGVGTTYVEPECPQCVQKIESCPVVVCDQPEPTECKAATNAEAIQQTNNTYTVKLIREIKRCEAEVRHYADSNKTVVCRSISERLELCQQKLNQTRELLE